METVFEFIFEIYLGMMMFIVPEDKANKYRRVAIFVAIVSIIGILALFFFGYLLITECDNLLGWIPISIAVVFSLAQIIAGFIIQSKK